MRVFLTILMATLLLASCAERPEGQTVTQADSRLRILQVGLVLDSPAEGAIQMALPGKGKVGRDTSEVLPVRIVPGLDESNLAKDQRVIQHGIELAVEVQFRGKARQQLADFTRTNIGKNVALIVDGKGFSTMKIGGEATDGRLLIPGKWTLQEAMAFCKQLSAPASSRGSPETQP